MDAVSPEEHTQLLILLKQKLADIPSDVLPAALTLDDIVEQTPKAVYLPNVPHDLQLSFLLAHRNEINEHGGLAIKSESQELSITRAIFFYRLSPCSAQQFQRYHDMHRWNTAIFIALLSIPRTSLSANNHSYSYSSNHHSFPSILSPPARRFAICYLAAVLEHHNEPTRFQKREEFVKLWKNSSYEFFSFCTAQKKLVKREMKKLSALWERELDATQRGMGASQYKQCVARFVGVLVPGREDQRAHPLGYAPKLPPRAVGLGGSGMEGMEAGVLLDALRVPLEQVGGEMIREEVKEVVDTVTRPRTAITAVQKSVPRDMLKMLMDVFPVEGK